MKILEKIEIIQGNASPTISLGVAGVKSLDGYSCEMKVTGESGQIVVKKRVEEDKITEGAKESFALKIKSSDTKSLEPESLYIWSIEIINDLVFYKEETRIGVFIKKKAD